MKSADDRIRDYIRNYSDSYGCNKNGLREYITLEWEHLEDMMKQYAREAIQQDRKNLIKYAEIRNNGYDWIVDDTSIINAPQIELP
jgi:hypothetical protein